MRDVGCGETKLAPFNRAEPRLPAFESVIAENYHKIFNLAFRYLGDYDDAGDVTQETFLHAYRAWADFRGEAEVFTWLYRIAFNLCHNRRRQLRRRRHWEAMSLDEPPSDEGDGPTPKDIPDESGCPQRALERRVVQETVRRALRRLPLHYQRVIMLRDLEDLSYRDIARLERCTVQTIKSRLCRARARLRQTLSSKAEMW
ncbi:MAG: sigma-70 family RNA polymerase sigma factor [Abditibacteriales bacterium]|nr:sigma-70 family RNA polymerase sigma factor [Abditibacteriales bacterium]MDW8364816.1 sigma-70 family RNA polymerase sigma factor [Abditibacteriales bacterium]